MAVEITKKRRLGSTSSTEDRVKQIVMDRFDGIMHLISVSGSAK